MIPVALAIESINKNAVKSLIVSLLCCALTCATCAFMGHVQSLQAQLDRLPGAIPVRASILNLSGSQNAGILIDRQIIEQIDNSGLVQDLTYTVKLAGNFAPETEEEKNRFKQISCMGFTSFEHYRAIQTQTIPPGDFLCSPNPICIVNQDFAGQHRLSVGDAIDLDLYHYDGDIHPGALKYVYLARCSLTIVDCFSPSRAQSDMTELPDVVFPIPWAEALFAKNQVPMYMDSASFFVADPLHLNDFKAYMKQCGLLELNPRAQEAVWGNAMAVNDETFVRAATAIKSSLTLALALMPAMLLMIAMVGYVVSFLGVQARKDEFAIMRRLGIGEKTCRKMYIVEAALLAGLGAASAAVLMRASTDIGPGLLAVIACGFVLLYALGVVAATGRLKRFSLMELLAAVE